MKLPKQNGEDTWSLLLEFTTNSASVKDVEWCLMESLGQYDNRWG